MLSGPQFIAGYLFLHEAIVWLVLVEGFDDVIAIAPGVRIVDVGLKTAAIAVSDDVEPVPGPSFSVTRGSRASFRSASDTHRATCRGRIFPLLPGSAGARSNRSTPVGSRSGGQRAEHAAESFLGELRGDERIDRIAHPFRIGGLRNGGFLGVRKDHQAGSAMLCLASEDQGAPASIHCFRLLSSSPESVSLPGGIFNSPMRAAA